jgi:hypothetical protein
MRTFATLAVALLVAGALAGSAVGGPAHQPSESTPGARVASIADHSSSWAEFSSKVPDLQAALGLAAP